MLPGKQIWRCATTVRVTEKTKKLNLRNQLIIAEVHLVNTIELLIQKV